METAGALGSHISILGGVLTGYGGIPGSGLGSRSLETRQRRGLVRKPVAFFNVKILC